MAVTVGMPSVHDESLSHARPSAPAFGLRNAEFKCNKSFALSQLNAHPPRHASPVHAALLYAALLYAAPLSLRGGSIPLSADLRQQWTCCPRGGPAEEHPSVCAAKSGRRAVGLAFGAALHALRVASESSDYLVWEAIEPPGRPQVLYYTHQGRLQSLMPGVCT